LSLRWRRRRSRGEELMVGRFQPELDSLEHPHQPGLALLHLSFPVENVFPRQAVGVGRIGGGGWRREKGGWRGSGRVWVELGGEGRGGCGGEVEEGSLMRGGSEFG
jgi:hypothetical protein